MADYSDINKQIVQLWREFPDYRGNRIPFLFPHSEDGCLLFVGFNPSFPPELQNREWIHPYDITRLDNIDEAQLIKQEIETQDYLPYFKPLKKIAAKLELPWSHFDVFMFRENSQTVATQAVYDANNNTFKPFGQKQFDLFAKALQRSNPRLIVVINALASRIIKTHLPLEYRPLDGCYYASRNKNIKAPFFLGGMLTGQRAVDVFSRERLIWHIETKLTSLVYP
ncbi:MAG: hypothetical protein ABR911_14295 [Syntrophales bacterium]